MFNALVRIGEYFPVDVPRAETRHAQARDMELCPTGHAAVRPQRQPGAWAVPHGGRRGWHLTFWHSWVIMLEAAAVWPPVR